MGILKYYCIPYEIGNALKIIDIISDFSSDFINLILCILMDL